MQRVWIQLTAHRGEFPYCGTLGSRLYQIAASDSKCEQKVLEAIEEALEFIPQVRVKRCSHCRENNYSLYRNGIRRRRFTVFTERRRVNGNV